MKKTLTLILAAVLVVSVFAVTGCTPVNGETYNGAVSQKSYASKDLAVEAFLEDEISGQTITARLVKYEKEKDLSEREIAMLGIPESDVDDLNSVEKVKVQYMEYNPADAVSAEKDVAETYFKTLYILQYGEKGDNFRYFTPALKVGESLTASYFASVFDVKNYVNCTQNSNVSVSVKGGGASLSFDTNTYSQLTETAFYTKIEAMGKNVETYAWGENNAVNLAVKSENKWETRTIENENGNLSDFISDYPQETFGDFDYSFFEKTKNGFTLRKDKVSQWLESYFESLGDMLPDGSIDFKKNFDLSYNAVVEKGRVVKTEVSATFTVANGTSEITVSVSGIGAFSDFGKTQVVVPDEVKALIK